MCKGRFEFCLVRTQKRSKIRLERISGSRPPLIYLGISSGYLEKSALALANDRQLLSAEILLEQRRHHYM